MNRSAPTILVMSLGLAGVLSACGGGGSSPSTSTSGNATGTGGGSTAQAVSSQTLKPACTILSKAIAKSVVGSPLKRTIDAKPNPKETHCHYAGLKADVDLLVGPWTYVQDHNPAAKKVAGFGDEATVSPSQFSVRKGTNGVELLVSITGSFSGTAANQVEAKQLKLEEKIAPKLIAQLP